MGLLVAAQALPALAVSVTNALYKADIVVTDNGAATTNVAVVCPINTQALIDGKYVTTNLLNTATQYSGGDIPYMPGVNTNPWVFWVPSIGTGETLPYVFYTGGPTMQTGFSYFPDSGGMTTNDNNTSLELGNNFVIEQKGYVDTTAGSNKNLVYKDGAFKTYVSADGSVSSTLYFPTSQIGVNSGADRALYAGSYTRAGQRINAFPVSTITSVEFVLWKSGAPTGTATVNVRKVSDDSIIGTLGTIDVSTLATGPTWYAFNNPVSITASQDIRILVEYSGGGSANCIYIDYSNTDILGQRTYYSGGTYTDTTLDESIKIYYNTLLTVTATGVTSGVRRIVTSDNTTTLTISVYDSSDVLLSTNSTPFAGSVFNNNNSWQFITNGSMLYMEYQKIWIGGTAPANLKQYIIYQRDTTFTDQSGNGNNATPTFRTTSSNSNISATFQNFKPIKEATCIVGNTEETPEMLLTPPEQPPEFFGGAESGIENLPGAAVINTLLDKANIPQDLFWIICVYYLALGAVIFSYHFIRSSLLWPTVVGGTVIALFSLVCLGNPIPLWTVFVYGIRATGWLVAERTFGW